MCGQGCRSDHLRMNISTDRRKAALRHNDGDAVEIHSQYGEYVYEHEKMNERAKIARPHLQNS
jgi:hypothetical protein